MSKKVFISCQIREIMSLLLIANGDPILTGVIVARHVGQVNNSELEPYKGKLRMAENLVLAAMRKRDHVALPVSAQLEWLEMGRHVGKILIWMDIQMRS